jgi:hypothetical protein
MFVGLTRGAYAATAENDKMTPQALDQAIRAYADRYVSRIAAATIAIARDNPSTEQRRLAHLMRLTNATSIYDIATSPDAFSNLIDLLAMATLQSYTWIDEDRAEKVFGNRAELLMRAFRDVRVDAWHLAAKVLPFDRLQQMDALLLDWRRHHPDVNINSFLRFHDLVEAQKKEALEEIRRSSGWFGIGDATQLVDDARLLAERAFYQTKRMPTLVSWQMESLLDETLANTKPEIAQSLRSVEDVLSNLIRKLFGYALGLLAAFFLMLLAHHWVVARWLKSN